MLLADSKNATATTIPTIMYCQVSVMTIKTLCILYPLDFEDTNGYLVLNAFLISVLSFAGVRSAG